MKLKSELLQSLFILIFSLQFIGGCVGAKNELRKPEANIDNRIQSSILSTPDVDIFIKIVSISKGNEPVLLSLDCKNLKGRDILWDWKWPIHCSLLFKGQDIKITSLGEEQLGPFGPSSVGGPRRFVVLPKEGKLFEFDLRKCFEISEAGEYFLELRALGASVKYLKIVIIK